MADLHTEWQKKGAEYEILKVSCEARVVKWIWYSGPAFSLQPLHFDRFRIKKGKRLKTKSAGNKSVYQYGFDAVGEPLVEREIHKSRTLSETFFIYGKAPEAVKFVTSNDPDTASSRDTGKTIVSLSRQNLRNDRVVRYEEHTHSAHITERYQYDNEGMIRQIKLQRKFYESVYPGNWTKLVRTLHYTPTGKLCWPREPSKSVRKIFREAEGNYQGLKKTAKQAVVRWQWYSAEAFDLNPLYFIRDNRTPGRALKSPPADRTKGYEYGFDSHNRVVVERKWSSSKKCTESFVSYGAGVATAAIFDDFNNDLVCVKKIFFRDGHPELLEHIGTGGESTERYHYKKGNICRADVWHYIKGQGDPKEFKLEIDYDENDKLRRLQYHWDGEKPYVSYQALPK